jgi:hypothetical protein
MVSTPSEGKPFAHTTSPSYDSNFHINVLDIKF